MKHTAPTNHPINDLLRRRWSPYAFDPDRAVSTEDLQAVFEAARWTMSSYNAQPWRYIVGVRAHDADLWRQILDTLVEGNQAWAKHAPVLAIGLVAHNFEHNGKPNKAAVHDLGAASANLTVEATARGLSVHQMIGIEPDKVRNTFRIDDTVEPFTGLAIGYVGDGASVEEKFRERDARERQRKSLAEIIIAGRL